MALHPGRESSRFVQTDGIQFTVNGGALQIAGANNYYLGFASDPMVESVFDLAARMGLNTLRTWAFLDCGSAPAGVTPGNAKAGVWFQSWDSTAGKPLINDGPDGLERLDGTISLAEQHGMRLILPLVNYWDDFGGMGQYAAWFGLTDRHEFYRDPRLKSAYRNYVEHLLKRVNTRTGRQYRDEPAILAWELANEPRSPDGIDTLLAWVDEMSAFAKSIDSNHLVGVGDEGYFHHRFAFGNRLYDGSSGVDCERLLKISGIDFGTCHLYPSFSADEDPAAFGTRWIAEHIQAGKSAGKPVLIEEFGVKSNPGQPSRDATFRPWLDEVLESEAGGALLWMIAGANDGGGLYPDYDGYTVYSAEDVPSVVAFARSASSSETV